MGKKLQDEKLAKEDVVDNLTTDEASKALSAAQGKALNDKIAEISNPASAEKDGLMSKEAVPVGKASFSEEALQENFNALMDAIVKAKPSALKGQYLRSITLTSTMGPGVKVSVAKF